MSILNNLTAHKNIEYCQFSFALESFIRNKKMCKLGLDGQRNNFLGVIVKHFHFVVITSSNGIFHHFRRINSLSSHLKISKYFGYTWDGYTKNFIPFSHQMGCQKLHGRPVGQLLFYSRTLFKFLSYNCQNETSKSKTFSF
jgi:hypothetical protein